MKKLCAFVVITKSECVWPRKEEGFDGGTTRFSSLANHVVSLSIWVDDSRQLRLILMKYIFDVILEVLGSAVEWSDVFLVGGQHRPAVELDTEFIVSLGNRHAHALVVPKNVLFFYAAFQRLELLADCVSGAVSVVVWIPKLEDAGVTVRVAAAISIAWVGSDVAVAWAKRSSFNFDICRDTFSIDLSRYYVLKLVRECNHICCKQKSETALN